MTPEVSFSPVDNSNQQFKYAVIAAKYNGQWVFVRNKLRKTWEIPGGHVEPGETVFEAACRELEEETGAKQYQMYEITNYSVKIEEKITEGRLFFAQITELGALPELEIGERCFTDGLPENLTYPLIQPYLFTKANSFEQTL